MGTELSATHVRLERERERGREGGREGGREREGVWETEREND